MKRADWSDDPTVTPKHRPRRSVSRWLSPLAAALLFVAALWVVHNELTAHSYHDVLAALRMIGPNEFALAIALACISPASLVLVKKLALAMIGKPMALKQMWRAAFSAYALGNTLGFSFATAPLARARPYRGQLAPAEGGSFEVLAPGEARAHGEERHAASAARLAHQASAQTQFSLGRFDLSYLDRTPVAVVRFAGRIVAFANVGRRLIKASVRPI